MRHRVAANLSDVPLSSTRSASPSWWGTLAFMLIEGTGFALSIGVYLYLASLAPTWPPAAPPDLGPGTAVTLVLLVSLVPNLLLGRWAEAKDLHRVRFGLLVMLGFSIVPLVLRIFEFRAIHVQWDDGAYGSIVWFLLGMHTAHLLSDLIETAVLTALMFTHHADTPRRYGDVQDEVAYWYFVVAVWVPTYACIYWGPRL